MRGYISDFEGDDFLTEKFFSKQKKRLLEIKKDILRQIDSSVKNFKQNTDKYECYKGDSAAGADALKTQNEFFDSRRLEIANQRVREINIALKKIEDGFYGYCNVFSDNCEEIISQKRLINKPEAKYCIHCQEEKEKHQKSFVSLEVGTKSRRVHVFR